MHTWWQVKGNVFVRRRVQPRAVSRREWIRTIGLLALGGVLSARAAPGELTVLVVPALKEALDEVLDAYRKEAGGAVAVEVVTARQLKTKVHSDDHHDVVLADQAAVDELQKNRLTQADARVGIGRVGLGVAGGTGQGRARRFFTIRSSRRCCRRSPC